MAKLEGKMQQRFNGKDLTKILGYTAHQLSENKTNEGKANKTESTVERNYLGLQSGGTILAHWW